MAQRISSAARAQAPAGTDIVRVERLSRAFVKYHLSNGQILHHFTHAEPNANAHDHPWSFETEILVGGYIEEVFSVLSGGAWSSELVKRIPGTTHRIEARHIHRIVELPTGDCWTLIRAESLERSVRF